MSNLENATLINNTIEDLDTSWIQDFDNIDNSYKMYYSEDISFIKINIVYINKDNNIDAIKEENIILKTNGLLSKEELLHIIKNNNNHNNLKYSIFSILKININIEPQYLKTFLKSDNNPSSFIQEIKSIDNINFDKSISMFHDLNELIIIFQEKKTKKSLKKCTKRILQILYHNKTKRK